MIRSHWKYGALIALVAIGAASSVRAADTSKIFLPLAINAEPPSTTQPLFSGDGTYYDATGAGNCMFDASPNDLMVGAMNNEQYGTADLCGAYVAITGPIGSVTVRIVDKCPECKKGDIDLSPQAFDKIAHRIDGRVPISWRVISPDISGPISYRFKEGSNPWWTAVQIRNHRNPIAKLEYKDSKGTFQPMAREDYNYFLPAGGNLGLGDGPYTFRVTDIYGNTLVDSNIPFKEAGVIAGAAQFPKMP